MTKPLVEIKDLSKIYHTPKSETVAVEGFSLNINEGEFISLVGPSGCGKSTVLSILAGLSTPSGGEIKYVSDNISIGYMLQHDCLFEWHTILDNTLLGLKIQGRLNNESEKYVKDMLTTYGLGDFINSYPRELSGGMRQRAALIRTLAVRPQLLLLDEPFSALDSQMRISVSEDISRIIKTQGVTTVLITHDLSEAICLSDKIVLLSKRPASVRRVYDIDLGEKNISYAQKRTSEKFSGYYESLAKELYE